MKIEELKSALIKVQEQNSSPTWFENLETRKKEEANFHDVSHHEDVSFSNKKWYKTVQLSSTYLDKWLDENVPNKIVLDYACGNGNTAVRAAKKGAKYVIGIDISPISIQNAINVAQKEGVADKCIFIQGDCEKTGMPDNCVDTVLCFGVLHHMDLNNVYPELQRIMKPQAKLLAAEALNHNPFITLYRTLTPELRTAWEKEHILNVSDVYRAKPFMDIGEVRFWHVTSFLSALLGSVPILMKITLSCLNGLDKILTRIPYIQRMAWQMTFELISKK
jgi:ubiquinone/menaquinone biosynthesis C-methylase UbiE